MVEPGLLWGGCETCIKDWKLILITQTFNNQQSQSFETKNRFEPLSDNQKQVFQKDNSEDTITLKDIMKEIM